MATSRNLEEFKNCERENGLLKEKLHVHLHRWGFDRAVLEESAFNMAREHELKSAQQTYELARVDLLHGIQIQRNRVLHIKLESALDEIEVMKPQLLRLKSALQQEMVNKKMSHEKLEMLKSAWRGRLASRSNAVVQLQKVLESRQRGYFEAVAKMKEKYSADTKQLDGRIQQLISELAELKNEREQWTLDKAQLQNLAVERDKLQTELEEVQTSLEERNRALGDKEHELQKLAAHRDRLMTEITEWNSQKQEMQALLQERDRVVVEKESWKVKEHEMQELAIEMENLRSQRDDWISQEEKLHQLTVERDQLNRRLRGKESEEFYNSLKERDKLAEKLDVVRSQREEEVKGLIRERDFVWSQLKKIEEDYTEKLNTVSGQLVQANQEISKLKHDLQQAHMESNDKMVEMTILKLEARRAEDDVKQLKESLAASKQVGYQAEAVDLSSKSKQIQQEEEKVVLDGPIKNLSFLELTPQIEILQKQLNAYRLRNQGGGLDALSKEGPEVLNAEDLTSDQDIFVSQVEQGTRADAEDCIKSSKDVEELRRENENLRVLYGQLEALYKEKQFVKHQLKEDVPISPSISFTDLIKLQRPEKVARTMTHKDPTSRNLKVELEAAAASSPSDEDPVLENVHGRMKRRVVGSKARGLKAKSGQKTSMKELRKQSGHDVVFTGPEEWGSPTQKATSSRTIKRSMSSSKPPLPSSSRRKENLGRHTDGPVKKVERKRKADEGSTTIQDLRRAHHEAGPLRRSTRKRKADSKNCDESQQWTRSNSAPVQRVPLLPVPVNESSYASVEKSKQQSLRKPEIGSVECKTKSSAKGSSSLMSNLFSAAFSIPRLNIQSSSVTRA